MKKLLLGVCFILSILTVEAQESAKAKLQDMYDLIKEAGIEEPAFVMAQCIQETGWLICRKCCLGYHNLFGFYIRGNKCKKFDSDEECIHYYKKWQDKRYPKWRKKNPGGSYYDFLKHAGYATGDKYTKELQPKVTWVKKHLSL